MIDICPDNFPWFFVDKSGSAQDIPDVVAATWL
jgi:hypothetical protein